MIFLSWVDAGFLDSTCLTGLLEETRGGCVRRREGFSVSPSLVGNSMTWMLALLLFSLYDRQDSYYCC